MNEEKVDVKKQVVKVDPKIIGTSLVSLVPTHNKVLLKGVATHSTLNMVKGQYDNSTKFTLTIVGFGKNVKEFALNDEVLANKHSLIGVDVKDNLLSYEYQKNEMSNMSKEETRALPINVQIVEYFLCEAYDILAVQYDFQDGRNLLRRNEIKFIDMIALKEKK